MRRDGMENIIETGMEKQAGDGDVLIISEA